MLGDRDYMSNRSRHAGRPQSVVKALIVANIVMFVLQLLSNDSLTVLLSLNAYSLARFEFWRLGTYMFAHGSLLHILMNMWGLFLFGRPLEQRLGGHTFLNLYLASGVIGGLSWLVFNWYPTLQPWRFMGVIGASGAVFGVMMAAAMMFPNQVIMLLFPPIPMKLKTFVLVFGGVEVLMALDQGGHIAHIAHLGGILGAFLFMRRQYGPRLWSPMDSLRGFARAWRSRRADRNRRKFTKGPGGKGDGMTEAELLAEVDRILDKMGRSDLGVGCLTEREKRILNQARDRLRRRGQ